jgi:hypothetical protein
VVETGALRYVARFNHNAPANKADNITIIKAVGSVKVDISIIPFFTVFTTSHPAIVAPSTFPSAAITIAHLIVIAPDPTAGQTLLATSLAPILIAIYPPSNTARRTKKLLPLSIPNATTARIIIK